MMEQNSAIEYFERSLVYIPSCSGKKVEMKKLKDGQKERNDEQQVIRNNYLLSENMYPPPLPYRPPGSAGRRRYRRSK